MSTPPSNLPFAPSDITDEELDAELEQFRPNVPAPVSPPSESPSPSLSPQVSQPTSVEASSPQDMFSHLDQAPQKSVAQMGLGDLPAAAPSPSLAKHLLLAIGVLILVGGIGFGFWYFAIKRPALERGKTATPTVVEPVPSLDPPSTADVPDTLPIPSDPTLPSTGSDTQPAILPTPILTPPTGANIPPPEMESASPPDAATSLSPTNQPAPTIDMDNDGLSDQREQEIGTDPRNADSDEDGLNDGDEVLKYGTNPLDRDTDKDSFLDGKEVQNGYNPRGGDRCAKPDCSI